MSIKISPDTINILNNYATITKGIKLLPGNELRVVGTTGTTASLAAIAESFPHQVPIGEIKLFISVLNLFKEPVIDFVEDQNHMLIKEADGSAEVVYTYSDPHVLKTPKGRIPLQGATINFRLNEAQLDALIKATGVFSKPEWAIIASKDSGKIRIKTFNSKTPQSDSTYSVLVDGETNGVECMMVLSFENLRLLKGNYDVTVSEIVTQFTNVDREKELVYWVGAEASSRWNAKLLKSGA